MKLKEVTQIFMTLGWSTGRDEVGDKIGYLTLSDRTAHIIYGVRKFPEDEQIEVMPSLLTNEFSKACHKIQNRGSSYSPLIVPFKDVCIRVPEVLEKHVRQASDETISWAKDQDLDKALQEHAALPTNAPGTAPILHLASLILLGDVAKLKTYQSSFEVGDRLGFVNYVTKDYIDRAVALCENKINKSMGSDSIDF